MLFSKTFEEFERLIPEIMVKSNKIVVKANKVILLFVMAIYFTNSREVISFLCGDNFYMKVFSAFMEQDQWQLSIQMTEIVIAIISLAVANSILETSLKINFYIDRFIFRKEYRNY